MAAACARLIPRTWAGAQPRRDACRRSLGMTLAQKAYHAFEPLIVLNLGECILDGIDGVVIGEVERRGALAVFGNVEMCFLTAGPWNTMSRS